MMLGFAAVDAVLMEPMPLGSKVSIDARLYRDLLKWVAEYREEAEGLGMPETVRALDEVLERAA